MVAAFEQAAAVGFLSAQLEKIAVNWISSRH